MVRLGGLTYAIDPTKPMGQRIQDIRVAGRPLELSRRYKATGWGRRRGRSSPRICAASSASGSTDVRACG